MQKWVCKILVVLSIAYGSQASAASADDILKKGDSLYSGRKYTQAFEVYQSLHAGGQYSPTMLLKMAYIQEGLGHLGESMYYLNLYFLATDDAQALKKMEELAEKNNLEGYETDESTKFRAWVQEQYSSIAFILASTGILLLAMMFYQRKRENIRPYFAGIAMTLGLALLFLHVNYSIKSERGIVSGGQTYLMSGPSSASSVIAIIGEGHQLQIKGKEDVWLKVEWKENDVYVREFLVKPVRL